MNLEAQLVSWTGPSSDTEQAKQERTERMIRSAIANHAAFRNTSYRVFVKGSYANNTNVRNDSDVDICVECKDLYYWDRRDQSILGPQGNDYQGEWSPSRFRREVESALSATLPGQVDASGNVAIEVHSSSARVDADVVPCFSYRDYISSNYYEPGTKIYTADGREIVNYPDQQLANGIKKNNETNAYYKRAVRILKRTAYALESSQGYKPPPSYFLECLGYNVPDRILLHPTWTDTIRETLSYIYHSLSQPEANSVNERWLEVNGIYYLFHEGQKWNRQMGADFAVEAWNYHGF